MSKLILLLFCNILSLNLAEYEAPRSAEYPFGDEAFNSDMREDRVQAEARAVTIEVIKDIYTFCPNITDDNMRTNQDIPFNDNKCSRCDIRPTVDKIGVLVECYNCTDVSVMLVASPEVEDLKLSKQLFKLSF